MTDWHTNLFKDYVPSPAQRRLHYIGMVSFLGLCGLVLVAIAYQASYRMVVTVHDRDKIQILETKFRSLHGDLAGNLGQIVSGLKRELEQTHDQLKSVNSMVQKRISLSRLLAGICQPLPYDVQLVRLDVNPAQGCVQFDLVMPDTPEGEMSQARALVDAYNDLPLLLTQLRDIRIVARQTQRVRDQSVVVLRLEGQLAGGKG